MLSRVADSLFWLGRYAERLETNAHIITRQLERLIENSITDDTIEMEFDALIKICGYYDEFNKQYTVYSASDIIEYLLFDESNLNSIVSLSNSVRFNLKNTRDIVPQEIWEVWHDVYNLLNKYKNQTVNHMEISSLLKQIRIYCLTSTGIIDSLMSRDEAYMFLKIGKWLERSEKTSLIAKTLLLLNVENNYSFAANFALNMTNTYDDFNRRHLEKKELNVLQYIICDEKCTRSVHYGVKKIHKTIVDLQHGFYESYTDVLFKELYDLKVKLRVDFQKLSEPERVEWLKAIHLHCTKFGPIFSNTYFLTPPILVD